MILIIETESKTIGFRNVREFSKTRGDCNGYDSIMGTYDEVPDKEWGYRPVFNIDVWVYELYAYKDESCIEEWHGRIQWQDEGGRK